MAHTKAQGAASRLVNMPGKRLGIKRAAGEFVTSGTILVRQRGTTFYPGDNTMLAKDYTIFATSDGYVSFSHKTGTHRNQKKINITPKQ
jgi:large subunit ribosomal protein L27